MVNSDRDCSSDSCGSSEDKGDPQHGDLYVGPFGDVIQVKT
jgi:hypothetical protein